MIAASDAVMTVLVFGGMGLVLFAAWVFERGVASYQTRNYRAPERRSEHPPESDEWWV